MVVVGNRQMFLLGEVGETLEENGGGGEDPRGVMGIGMG